MNESDPVDIPLAWSKAVDMLNFINDLAKDIANQTERSFQPSFELAQKKLVEGLTGGELLGIGRNALDDSVEKIDRSFWVGATLDCDANSVLRGNREYVDVRILSTDLPPRDRGFRAPDDAESLEATKPSGGRTNTSNEIRELAEQLLDCNAFTSLPNRTFQARELRARLLGEQARHQDHRAGYKTSRIARLIGEVANSRK